MKLEGIELGWNIAKMIIEDDGVVIFYNPLGKQYITYVSAH